MSRFVAPSTFEVSVASLGEEHFKQAMGLSFAGGRIATHFKIDRLEAGSSPEQTPRGDSVLTFFWHEHAERSGALPLPYPMDVEAAVGFAWNWLKRAEYAEEPDTDGSTEKGFRVDNANSRKAWAYELCAIWTAWMIYGK